MKLIFYIISIFVVFLCLNPDAAAQAMPPPAHPNSPYYVPPGAQSGNGVVVNEAKWESRWGAIASDGKGHYGITGEFPNERSAKNAALLDCKKEGGINCRLKYSYRDQCSAIVASDYGNAFIQLAPYENEAKDIAAKRCADENGKDACWVYYSGCSLPVRVD